METATNPQTGETIAYVNGQWVPLPTGGLSFDRLRNTPRPVTPLDGAAYAAQAEDVGLGGQFMRSAVNAAGADTVAGIGGALQSLGFEETGQGLRDWGERNALPPAGVRSIGEIDSWGDVPSYIANMGGMAVGSTLPVVGTAAVGALAGSAVPVVGTVAGGLTGAALGSYGINEGQTYIQIRQALEDAGASKEDAHTTAAEIAIPLGVPIAALDVFSLSRALPFLKGSVRDAAQSVVEEAAKRGLLGTAARETLAVGTREGVTETAQTGLQELGQASVDPNYDWSQLGTKMVDSAVAGALGGGMFGAFGAPSARANARAEVARRADVTEQDAARAAAIETRDTQNRVIDQIAGQQLLLPPPSAETRRTPYRAAAMADLTAAQDAVTRVEGTLAAYPTPANQKRLEIVTRARDSALARLESINQTDVFASQQEAPQVSATTRSAIEDQETERRRKAAVDAEAAARGVAPAAVTREQTSGEALRLRLESIDRAIRSVKADLKQRPGFAPSVAKLNFYDQQRAAAVAALGPKPADQLSGATRTIRAPSPDTDIQAFARETARKIVGDPNFWVPIKESDKAPVTGYVNYQTGEIRTPEQHLAPIETPLSGRDPTIPSPEEMAKRAQVERDVAQGATAAQDAAAADKAVEQRQRQDAVTAAQKAAQEAQAQQEKSDAAAASAVPESPAAVPAPVGQDVAPPAAPAPSPAPLPAAPQAVAAGTAAPQTQSEPVVNETPIPEQVQQGATETVAPPPARLPNIRMDESAPGVSGIAAQEMNRARVLADQIGITPEIEAAAASSKTAEQIANDLGNAGRLAAVDQASVANGEPVGRNRANFVRAVRNTLGIPSMDQRAEFEAWRAQHQQRQVPARAADNVARETPAAPATKLAGPIPPGAKQLGQNAKGEALFEDARGTRFVQVNGTNTFQPVARSERFMLPGEPAPAPAPEPKKQAKKAAAKPAPDKAMRPDEPGAEPQPQSHEARIAKAETDIRAMLKRMTGKDIDFSILGEPMMIDGQAAAGGYNTQTGALVVSAFDDSGQAYSSDQLLGIARHEAIHWMKDNGLFPEGSWSALEKATPAWMRRFKIAERYGQLTAEQQREEAIAEAYRAWGAGRLKLRGGPIQTAFEFIKRMLASIRGLFQQNGFQSVEDIFRGIDTGAFAKADEETGPSNIGRDSEWTMLAIGGAPGAPATMSIEDQMRASTARVWGVNRLFGDTKTARSVGSFIDRTRGSLQYYMLPWQRAEEAIERITGQPLPEGVRATTAELYVTGKLGHARLEKDRLYYQPVMDLIKKHNIPLADVGNYLLAMHAPERNAQIAKINPKKTGTATEEVDEIGPDGKPVLDANGKPKKIKKTLPRDGSGITDAEAAKRLKDLNAKPYAPQLAEIQKLVVEMNNAGLDILASSGRQGAASAQRMKDMYQNYVNLSGTEDPDAEFDDAPQGNGRGFMGTRGPAVRRATGRFSEPTEILANSLAEYDARVSRAEKNLVTGAAFNLASAHPDPNLWTVEPVERRARINKTTGQVSYVIQQDRGADVMIHYVDGEPFAIKFNTQRQQGRDLYESLAKLNGVEVNRVFALMMRANQLLSRLNTTLNPEFMLSAPIKDWQEAGINLQQYGVKRVAQKTAGHLPGAMKAAWRYMNGKEPGSEWDKWAREFAAGGGITYFADQTSSESYVKQINRDIKKRSGPVGLTMGGVRALWHAIERTNNSADMGTRLAAYRTLVEAGMSKPKAVAAAKNLTVNFNRKGSQGPAMNAMFMFFNASVQGTATMATAIKNSKVVKGLVLGVVATGIAQELALSLLSPPDPDDPTRTVYDAIPEYVKQRNLILWVDDDGSYGMFPKPWGYGFFHDVGRVMTRYLRGAPMGVGRSASVLDTIRDTATSFANAFVPPGFDSALPVPTIFNPLVEVATNKDYTGKPIMPARMPGDRRPNSQMFYPGESPITVGVADALNSLTGGDQFRPGLVDISPEALSHVFSSYAGAAGSFYTRAANTIWGAGAEALGFNREDPDLDWNDVPFGRKIVGQTGSWQVQDLTYQRIADVELLEDEIAGYQEQGDRERARELRAQNGPLVALAKEGRRVRRELSEMRRDRQALLDGPLPTDQARARIDALEARQDRVMAAWNARYVRALARVQARTP